MTQSSTIPGPRISATLLFRRLAPACAEELARRLHRLGLVNSNDLIWAAMTGLRHFAREHGVSLAEDFPAAWPEALSCLQNARSEVAWERLLPQTATAPQGTNRQGAFGAAQLVSVLKASSEAAGMSPRIAVALGTWIVTAVVIAHSGPLDADLSLEELADGL